MGTRRWSNVLAMKRSSGYPAFFTIDGAQRQRSTWSIKAVMLLIAFGFSVQAAITPFFSVRPEVLPASQSSRVLLTVRTWFE